MNTSHSKHTILIVEDEPKLAQVLIDYLQAAGYETQWLADGNSVEASVRAAPPSLILLDLMLPGRDGLTLCKDLRVFSNVPIIMVTARVEEIDRLLGLELGADDYICKPYSPREVVARVKAILRRIPISAPEPVAASKQSAARFQIDDERFSVHFDGHLLELTPVEFRLIKTLVATPGRVFARDQLLDLLYEDNRVVTDRTVDSHIKNLRRKLEHIAPNEEPIRSIYGVGYKLDI